MGRKRTPGLRNRNGTWHIEKQFRGTTIRESTGTSDLKEAELILARRLEELRQAQTFGVRPRREFREAAAKYLEDNLHLARIEDSALHLRKLDPFIGQLPLDQVHLGTLEPFIERRRQDGVKTTTINRSLEVVRRILNLASRLWRDEHGLTWLETAPLIQMLPVSDARKPYPLSWEEQRALLQELPDHLEQMALFQLNTGTREQEVCRLQWDWEIPLAELDTSVFLIPGEIVKNREDRLVVLNRVAREVVEAQRGQHATHVFSLRDRPVAEINNTAWQKARVRAALQLIKAEAGYAELKEETSRTRQDASATVRCLGSDGSDLAVSTYTLDEHEADRQKRGLAPMKGYQRRDPNLRQTLLHKARQRLIDDYWPAYSAFSRVRNHDLKHTSGRRLRAAGVPLETRKVLLGHTNGDITSHYSAPELEELIAAAERICEEKSGKSPALIVLKRKTG